MRRWILPEAGFVLAGDVWGHPERESIPDAEVAEHYTRLMAEREELRAAGARVIARKAREKAEAFVALLRGE